MKSFRFSSREMTVFTISLFCIALELFITRILNLKSSNHLVYVIIPFAILGYGVGANIFLIFEHRFRSLSEKKVIAHLLMALAVLGAGSSVAIANLPIRIAVFQMMFKDLLSGLTLIAAYLILMIPFALIGLTNLFIFSRDIQASPRMYFWNLLGSGVGAVCFFLLIYQMEVMTAVLFLSVVCLGLGLWHLLPDRQKWAAYTAGAVLLAAVFFLPELSQYENFSTGWENFSRYYKPEQFETYEKKWHPLGRTDVYYLKDRFYQALLRRNAAGTFGINLDPVPEFVYTATNYLAGTPIFNLSEEGKEKYGSRLKLFKDAMEFPYVLVREPKVVIIGAGGGRDIHFALSHNAQEVVGAEINPAIYSFLKEGGAFHEYSGGIYTRPNTRIANIDGRHLVKTLPRDHYDLVVLNGVDTFSGLSSGAYMYSESYLYTVNAVRDYLRVLKDRGMINFNRWIFPENPRESLRLMAIIMEALRQEGYEKPWEHIIIGDYIGWGMILVKKTSFSGKEIALIQAYFDEHGTEWIYPSKALAKKDYENVNQFDILALKSMKGEGEEFIDRYLFDISPITDDSPFFYKYYRLRDFHPKGIRAFGGSGIGYLAFIIQGVVLFHALLFSVIFIGLPLFIFKREDLKNLPGGSVTSFVGYFACLGLGFMFVEIPVMQRFVLLLGSPIYSISVILAGLLIFAGAGSYCLPVLQKRFTDKVKLLFSVAGILSVLLLGLGIFGTGIINSFIGFPFFVRIAAALILIAPFGFCLGMFFPAGLQTIKEEMKGAMAWAWGVNCGFSVLGSMLAIIMAQFRGFSFVIFFAVLLYIYAVVMYRRLLR